MFRISGLVGCTFSSSNFNLPQPAAVRALAPNPSTPKRRDTPLLDRKQCFFENDCTNVGAMRPTAICMGRSVAGEPLAVSVSIYVINFHALAETEMVRSSSK